MSNETKWTPGPWVIRQTGPHWNNAELCNIEINYGADGECVCDTVYEMADANLIAAAPELYDELEIMDSILTHMIEDGYTGYVDRRRSVRKVLAKARGEQ